MRTRSNDCSAIILIYTVKVFDHCLALSTKTLPTVYKHLWYLKI